MLKMQKLVYERIVSNTRDIRWDLPEGLTAGELAGELGVGRNTVSQYLNEYVEQGEFVKIKSRPVLFLDRRTLEELYGVSLPRSVYDTIKALREALKSGEAEQDQGEARDFGKLIGHRGSLEACVEQLKSAMAYPPDGLPVLLNGESGIGKSMMAQLMHEYGVNRGILKGDAPFVTLNCSEYANNPELMATNLFGHVKGAYTGAVAGSAGLLQAADGGVLFLDEVHCLRPECQEKLFLFMDKGIYHRMGDNVNWHSSKVRLIFATTEEPEKVLVKTLLRRIPLICRIPSIAERPEDERHELICRLFREEMRTTGRQFYISRRVYHLLMTANFGGNIGEIKNCVRACCANAFLAWQSGEERENKGPLCIRLSSLPESLLLSAGEPYGEALEEDGLISLEELDRKFRAERSENSIYVQLIREYQAYLERGRDFSRLLEIMLSRLEGYYDRLSYAERVMTTPRYRLFESLMESVSGLLAGKYSLALHSRESRLLAMHFYNRSLAGGEEDSERLSRALDGLMEEKLRKERSISQEICGFLEKNIGITTGNMDRVFLTLAVKSNLRDVDLDKAQCFILCHGHSAAGSMAAAANAILGAYVYDAVDMPLAVPAEQVIANLLGRLKKLRGCTEFVFLVDLGSLEQIFEQVRDLDNADVGFADNVSLGLALELGRRLLAGEPLEPALEAAAAAGRSKCRLACNRRKEDVILAVCATGLEMAAKITRLLENCLPRPIPAVIRTYDYAGLVEEGLQAPVFVQYHVKFIIGTLDPRIPGVPFVSLDQLVSSQDVGLLGRLFSDYYAPEEIRELEQNLIHQFSLQNILDYLTILNAEKVLSLVSDALEQLQRRVGYSFSKQTVTGLYLHLCCLIERLVLRRDTAEETGIDRFIDRHGDFVEDVKNCFSVVESYYSVGIPAAEIRYIYDYVKADRNLDE